MNKITVRPKNVKKRIVSSTYVKAEDEEYEDSELDDEMDDGQGVMDAIDDVAENVEDLQDAIDDTEEDDVDIIANNNITDHFIAECEDCKGIFISAVILSDQQIDHVSGKCPLCGKETDQYLKWVIKDVN